MDNTNTQNDIERRLFYPWNDIQEWKEDNKDSIEIIAEVKSPYKFDTKQKQTTIFFRYK